MISDHKEFLSWTENESKHPVVVKSDIPSENFHDYNSAKVSHVWV